jgi:hypothetical protein
MAMKKIYLPLLMCILMVGLLGCTAGRNPAEGLGGTAGVAGFWLGVWHGFIAPFTFCISLFSHSVHFYEVHNNGNWYNFGFVIGAGIIFGGGGRSSRRRSNN